MKKMTYFVIVMALMMTLFAPGSSALAQSATSQTWTSSITYYTPSTTSGELSVTYYQGTMSYTAGPFTLNPHKAGSLFIGSTSVPDNFAGSAVLSADVPIVATYVQFAAGAENANYGRMLYNAFTAANSGSTFYVPTVLYQTFGSTSRVGVQNVESFEITATLKFYAVGSTTATATKTQDIKAYASYVFTPADITGLSPGFNGSLVITATKKGDAATAGRVVASSEETDDAGRGAYAFEGVANGSSTVYMPSAMCNYGSEMQTSFYAIQNAGTGDASVTIDYYNTSGTKVASMPATTVSQGGKLSRSPCSDSALVGALGSAVIKSTGAEIIAIGKVKANNGMATAYVGQNAGFKKLAAPYIRWSANPSAEFQAYVAIMNVGGSNATNITATYYDANGTAQGTHNVATGGNPLANYTKRNTTPVLAGALDGSGNFGISPFGGAVEISSDQDVVVVVRLQKNVSLGATTRFAEDYNGVDVSTP